MKTDRSANIYVAGYAVHSISKRIVIEMSSIFQYILSDNAPKSMFLIIEKNKSLLMDLTFLSVNNETCDIDFNRLCECGLTNKKI